MRASVYSCVCNGEGIKGEGGRDGGRGWGEESDVRSAAVRHKLLEEEEELEGWEKSVKDKRQSTASSTSTSAAADLTSPKGKSSHIKLMIEK